jgi:hypothetical protein
MVMINKEYAHTSRVVIAEHSASKQIYCSGWFRETGHYTEAQY